MEALAFGNTGVGAELAFLGATPYAREYAAAALDVAHDRMVMFGGWIGDLYDDTWTLSLGDDPQWTEIVTAHRPSPRRDLSMTFDLLNQRSVMFGGFDNDQALGDPVDPRRAFRIRRRHSD